MLQPILNIQKVTLNTLYHYIPATSVYKHSTVHQRNEIDLLREKSGIKYIVFLWLLSTELHRRIRDIGELNFVEATKALSKLRSGEYKQELNNFLAKNKNDRKRK